MSCPLLPRLALAGVLLACGTAAADAQCAFNQSSPSDGDLVQDPATPMTIEFMVEIDLKDVRLLGPGNAEVPLDWAPVKEEVRSVEFRPVKPLPPGHYMIEWNGYIRRHFHADGGSISFTVASAEGTPPGGNGASPAAAPTGTGAPPSVRAEPYRAFLGAAAPQPGR